MMVNAVKYVCVMLCLALRVSAEQSYVDENGKTKDCAIYDEAWRVSKCASSLKEGDMISDKLFVFYLHVAERKVPSSTVYTSVGFTTGVERELVVGKQSHADFDQWSYSLTYDPRAMLTKRVILSMYKEYVRPVLFFSKTVPEGIPVWDDMLIPSLRMSGKGSEYYLFRSKNADSFIPQTLENCASFYEWESRESFENAVGSVVIMDPHLWCPAMDNTRFDVVVGDVEEIRVGSLTGDTQYQTVWEVTRKGAVGGRLDREYELVF